MVQHFTLPDGRRVDYLVSGASDGYPLIFIHGTPGAFTPPPGFPEACEKKGIKLITLSRAGYGDSTREKGRKIVNVVPDIEALKKQLGIEKCLVGGWSGGGPHSLACAARLSGCEGSLVVAGVAPHDLFNADGNDWIAGQGEDNVNEYHASLKGEPTLQEFCKTMREEMLKADAPGIVESISSLLPDVDKEAILNSPGMGDNIVESFQESLKHSADGYVDDALAFIQPWGFDLDEIKVPISLWQGSLDLMVPYAHGQWFAKRLPQQNLKTHLMEGQGHVSIFLGKTDDMLDELKSFRKS